MTMTEMAGPMTAMAPVLAAWPNSLRVSRLFCLLKRNASRRNSSACTTTMPINRQAKTHMVPFMFFTASAIKDTSSKFPASHGVREKVKKLNDVIYR